MHCSDFLRLVNLDHKPGQFLGQIHRSAVSHFLPLLIGHHPDNRPDLQLGQDIGNHSDLAGVQLNHRSDRKNSHIFQENIYNLRVKLRAP